MSSVRADGKATVAVITPIVRADGALARLDSFETQTIPPRVIKASRNEVMRIIADGAVEWRGVPAAVRIRSNDIAALLRNEPRMLPAADGSLLFRIEPLRPRPEEAYAAEPLVDEVIVSRADLPDFLATPVVPGVQAKPCRLALSPEAVVELNRFGSTTLSMDGGRRLDVIVAGSPLELLRPGGPLVQHVWTRLGAAEIDPLLGDGDEMDARPFFWTARAVSEPVLAAVSIWRFTAGARRGSQGSATLDARLNAAFGFEPSLIVGLDALAPGPPGAAMAAAEFVLAVAEGAGARAIQDASLARICALAPNPYTFESAGCYAPASGARFLRAPAAERLEALDQRFSGLAAVRTSTVLGICRNIAVVEMRRDAWPAEVLNLSRDSPKAEAESIERPDRLMEAGS